MEEAEDNEEEEQSYSSSEAEQEKDFTSKLKWVEQESCPRKSQAQSLSASNGKFKTNWSYVEILKFCEKVLFSDTPPVLQQQEVDSTQMTVLQKEQAGKKTKQCNRGSQAARDSGVAESMEDRNSGFSLSDR